MTHLSKPSVRVDVWVAVDANSKITYDVLPAADTIEFTLGGRNGLALQASGGGLRHCIATFTEALTAFEAAVAASRSDAARTADHVPPVSSPRDR